MSASENYTEVSKEINNKKKKNRAKKNLKSTSLVENKSSKIADGVDRVFSILLNLI